MTIGKFFVLIFALVAAPSAVPAQSTTNTPLEAVPSVDINRYSGKWYEIARYPNKFQKQCFGNTTATYTRKPDGRIEVLNECLKRDGTTDSAIGAARVADKFGNSKLKVRFAPRFLSSFGFVWADYWIIDLGSDYEYAVVGNPKREYLWILSRQPELPTAVYEKILRRLEQKGFNPARLEKTPQKIETVKGAVVERP